VVDKIQKVGRNARQGNSLLRNKLLNINDGGNTTTFPPPISFEGLALAD
jgi:hypothetical protein